MSGRRTTLVVVGWGAAGRRQARSFGDLLGDIRVVAVRRAPAPAEDGVDVVLTDLGHALDHDPVLVVLAGPAPDHPEQLALCMRAGVPTLVEKPLAASTQQLLTLEGLVDRPAAVCAVGYNLRFTEVVVAARAGLAAGLIGELRSAHAWVGQDLREWRGGQDPQQSISARAATGGGALLELSHEIDLARLLNGEVRDVFCRAEQVGDVVEDVEDVADLVLGHGAARSSVVHLDLLAYPARRRLLLLGTEGTAEVDVLAGQIEWRTARGFWEERCSTGVGDSYLRQAEAFLAVVDGRCALGDSGLASLEDGAAAVAIVDAAKASQRTGRVVRVPTSLTST